MNLAFTLIEIAGGFWTNSVAIVTDAVHDAGDCISLGVAWRVQKLAERGRNEFYTYGYRRFSVLGALVTGAILIAGLMFVLWHAIERLRAPEPVLAPGMIVLALAGVVMNGAAVLRVRRGTSLNERMVRWHLVEDVLGWVSVLAGAVIIQWTGWNRVDALLSIGIALFVAVNAVRNLRQVFAVFLQRAPAGFDVREFERRVRRIPGVLESHHTHVWTMDGEHHVLTTHLVMARECEREQIAAAKEAVRSALGPGEFEHVTVDVELEGESCVDGRVSACGSAP